KIGIDATRKMKGEEVNGVAIEAPSASVKPRDGHPSALRERCVLPEFGAGRCAFIIVDKKTPGDGARALESIWKCVDGPTADFVIVVDATVDMQKWEEVFFHLCANTDPCRDLLHEKTVSGTVSGRVGFDATTKMKGDERLGQPVRDYPPFMRV